MKQSNIGASHCNEEIPCKINDSCEAASKIQTNQHDIKTETKNESITSLSPREIAVAKVQNKFRLYTYARIQRMRNGDISSCIDSNDSNNIKNAKMAVSEMSKTTVLHPTLSAPIPEDVVRAMSNSIIPLPKPLNTVEIHKEREGRPWITRICCCNLHFKSERTINAFDSG